MTWEEEEKKFYKKELAQRKLVKMFYKDIQKRLKTNKKIVLSIEGNREEGMSATAIRLQKFLQDFTKDVKK